MAKTPAVPALRVGRPGDRTGTTGRQGASGRPAPRPAATSTEQPQRNAEMLAGARASSGATAMPAAPRTARPGTAARPATSAAARNASVPPEMGERTREAANRTTTTAARAGTTSQRMGAPARGPVRMNQPTVRTGSSGGRPSAAQNPSNRPKARVTGSASGNIRGIRVEALQVGYYDNERKRPGDVFTIRDMQEFSDGENDRWVEEEIDNGRGGTRTQRRRLPRGWMRLVDAATPERTTTPNEAIRQEHDRILTDRVIERQGGGVPRLRVGTAPAADRGVSGDLDVLGEGSDEFDDAGE